MLLDSKRRHAGGTQREVLRLHFEDADYALVVILRRGGYANEYM